MESKKTAEGMVERLTRPSELRAMLEGMGFKPSRVLGQNFMIDRNILNILLEASGVEAGDEVVEVGPGPGVLTAALLARGARVTAVEKDRRLAGWLRESLGGAEGFRLVEGDATEVEWEGIFAREGMKVAANLPYAVAARLLVEWAWLERGPARMAVTVQKEVGERMAAEAGDEAYGVLSVLLQRRYAVAAVKTVSPRCFWPPPEVQSAIMRLDRLAEPRGGAADDGVFRALVKAGFGQRRKTLARALREMAGGAAEAEGWLAAAGIGPKARAEEVPVEGWAGLARAAAAGHRSEK